MGETTNLLGEKARPELSNYRPHFTLEPVLSFHDKTRKPSLPIVFS